MIIGGTSIPLGFVVAEFLRRSIRVWARQDAHNISAWCGGRGLSLLSRWQGQCKAWHHVADLFRDATARTCSMKGALPQKQNLLQSTFEPVLFRLKLNSWLGSTMNYFRGSSCSLILVNKIKVSNWVCMIYVKQERLSIREWLKKSLTSTSGSDNEPQSGSRGKVQARLNACSRRHAFGWFQWYHHAVLYTVVQVIRYFHSIQVQWLYLKYVYLGTSLFSCIVMILFEIRARHFAELD